MKLIQVTKPWTDSQLKRKTELGEILEVSDERAEVLLTHPEKVAREVTSRDIKIARLLGKEITPPLKSPKGLHDAVDKKVEEKGKEDKKPKEISNGTPKPAPAKAPEKEKPVEKAETLPSEKDVVEPKNETKETPAKSTKSEPEKKEESKKSVEKETKQKTTPKTKQATTPKKSYGEMRKTKK